MKARKDDEHFGMLYTRLINIFHFSSYVLLQFTSREDKLTGYSRREQAKQTHTSRQKEKGKINGKKLEEEEGLEMHNKLIKNPVKWPVHISWRWRSERESTHHPRSTSPVLSVCLHMTVSNSWNPGKQKLQILDSSPRGDPEENFETLASCSISSLPLRSVSVGWRLPVRVSVDRLDLRLPDTARLGCLASWVPIFPKDLRVGSNGRKVCRSGDKVQS